MGRVIQLRDSGSGHVRAAAGAMSGGQDAGANHVAVMTTIRTSTGQVTLIVNDDSHWKAGALSVICERAVTDAISGLSGMQCQPDEAGTSSWT